MKIKQQVKAFNVILLGMFVASLLLLQGCFSTSANNDGNQSLGKLAGEYTATLTSAPEVPPSKPWL
ncbi:MAG: hypothetical protein ACRDFB_04410, partial [Rhabdochlamydiaceae bacterium]